MYIAGGNEVCILFGIEFFQEGQMLIAATVTTVFLVVSVPPAGALLPQPDTKAAAATKVTAARTESFFNEYITYPPS